MTPEELKKRLGDIPQADLEAYMREMCDQEGGDWCRKSSHKPLFAAIIFGAIAVACWLYYKQNQA